MIIDLTGKEYDGFTVLYKSDKTNSKGHKVYWVCRCKCCLEHNIFIARTDSIINGKRKSCGCLSKQNQFKDNQYKKYNKYDLSGKYGIGYTSKGEEFYFDLEDYDKIKNVCWSKSSYNYIVGDLNGVQMKLHRLILNVDDSTYVDHINHNTVDNRKYNLRICNNSINQINKKLQKNNVSGVAGVWWDKTVNKWKVNICRDFHRVYLGSFNDFDEAVRVRKEAEKKYFGEYSYENSMKIGDDN